MLLILFIQDGNHHMSSKKLLSGSYSNLVEPNIFSFGKKESSRERGLWKGKIFVNIVEKGENLCNQHFLLFSPPFLLLSTQILNFYSLLLYPRKTNVFRGVLETAYLSVCVSVCPSVYKILVCQSAGANSDCKCSSRFFFHRRL